MNLQTALLALVLSIKIPINLFFSQSGTEGTDAVSLCFSVCPSVKENVADNPCELFSEGTVISNEEKSLGVVQILGKVFQFPFYFIPLLSHLDTFKKKQPLDVTRFPETRKSARALTHTHTFHPPPSPQGISSQPLT